MNTPLQSKEMPYPAFHRLLRQGQFSLSLLCCCVCTDMEEQKEEEQFKRVSELVATASSVLPHVHSIHDVVCPEDSQLRRVRFLQPVPRLPERGGRWIRAESPHCPNDPRLCGPSAERWRNAVVHSLEYRHFEGQPVHSKQAEL